MFVDNFDLCKRPVLQYLQAPLIVYVQSYPHYPQINSTKKHILPAVYVNPFFVKITVYFYHSQGGNNGHNF